MTKGGNRAFDRRQIRAKEKKIFVDLLSMANDDFYDCSYSKGKMVGRCCRRCWGDGKPDGI